MKQNYLSIKEILLPRLLGANMSGIVLDLLMSLAPSSGSIFIPANSSSVNRSRNRVLFLVSLPGSSSLSIDFNRSATSLSTFQSILSEALSYLHFFQGKKHTRRNGLDGVYGGGGLIKSTKFVSLHPFLNAHLHEQNVQQKNYTVSRKGLKCAYDNFFATHAFCTNHRLYWKIKRSQLRRIAIENIAIFVLWPPPHLFHNQHLEPHLELSVVFRSIEFFVNTQSWLNLGPLMIH